MAKPETKLELDRRVYRLSAIKKAVYRVAGKISARIETGDGEHCFVYLTNATGGLVSEKAQAEFLIELIDQELREQIAAETDGIRNLLLAQAFSQTSLLDPKSETGDVESDPLGIRLSEEQTMRTSELNR